MRKSKKYLGVSTLGPVGGDFELNGNTLENMNRVLSDSTYIFKGSL